MNFNKFSHVRIAVAAKLKTDTTTSNIAYYAFNIAMRRIYHISRKLLPILCTTILDNQTFLMILYIDLISFK